MQGKQKGLLYLPEAHTDYIYAVVGEELGMWGTTGLSLRILCDPLARFTTLLYCPGCISAATSRLNRPRLGCPTGDFSISA